MKNSYLAFFLIATFSTCCCENNENCHRYITILNNSGDAIYFMSSYEYPDTLTLPNPLTAGNYYKIDEYSTHKYQKRDCFEYEFKLVPKLIFFIFDANTLENTPWDTIQKKYLILKRYDLNITDIDSLSWTISFP
jgi:hypothetical protein